MKNKNLGHPLHSLQRMKRLHGSQDKRTLSQVVPYTSKHIQVTFQKWLLIGSEGKDCHQLWRDRLFQLWRNRQFQLPQGCQFQLPQGGLQLWRESALSAMEIHRKHDRRQFRKQLPQGCL